MTCDGCELRFDPGTIRHQPAPTWRRVLGIVLLTLSGLAFLSSTQVGWKLIVASRQSPLAAKRLPFGLVGAYLPPVCILGIGLRYLRGKTVVARPAPASDPAVQEAGPDGPDEG